MTNLTEWSLSPGAKSSMDSQENETQITVGLSSNSQEAINDH
jgi:hypothetical protein